MGGFLAQVTALNQSVIGRDAGYAASRQCEYTTADGVTNSTIPVKCDIDSEIFLSGWSHAPAQLSQDSDKERATKVAERSREHNIFIHFPKCRA